MDYSISTLEKFSDKYLEEVSLEHFWKEMKHFDEIKGIDEGLIDATTKTGKGETIQAQIIVHC